MVKTLSMWRMVIPVALVACSAAMLRADASADVTATRPAIESLPDPVDDAVFFEDLRRRGLHRWLDQGLRDVSATDQVGTALARRERLLWISDAAGASVAAAQEAMKQAGRVLAELIRDHPNHPGRLGWQFELAREYLERQSPAAFDNLMLYELPGNHAKVVRELSGRAVDALTSMRQRKDEIWTSLEALDEASLANLRATGSLAELESLDARSAMLLAWARLYRALAAAPADKSATADFEDILAQVTQNGWLDLPAGHESEQAGAALMAAVCRRRLGQYDEADAQARQVVAILGRIADRQVRQRMRQAALIAVLEQIRANRDAGRYEAALQAAEQARGWCLKNRPDEPSALVAVAVLEATILQARASAATAIASQPDASLAEHAWFRSSDCLAALQRAADQSAAHRDLLYRVLAPTVASVAPVGPLAPFALQLLLGAAVAEPDPARLDELIATARKSSAQDSAQTPAIAGEIRYLLGSALAERQARPEAVQVWTDLAEQAPKHDRAVSAIHQAVALAADDLRRTGPSGTAATRAAFVRAVRVLRQQNPNDANLPELSYASAAALETDAKFEEAVEAYMAVPVGHTRARDADMGRLRCWRQTLDEAVARRQDPASVAVLADKARAAVRSVRQRAATRPAHPAADCRDATLDVAVAELLNHQFIGGAAEASQALAEFETLYPACQNLLGPVLRQRILALRQLKQLGDARGMVDRYLAADPENAGSVMAGLLQAMHEEMLAALDRADESAASRVADEAAQLSRALLEWSTARPGRMSPSHLVVLHLWYAAALVQADRPVEAVAVLDQVPPAARASLPADSATLIDLRLTRADALLANQQADQAAAIYGDVWQHSVEQSAPWWHAFIGSLRCHARLPGDTHQVLQSIRQQRYLAPDLGGGRWRHQIEQLESAISAAATQPAQQPASQPDADRPR